MDIQVNEDPFDSGIEAIQWPALMQHTLSFSQGHGTNGGVFHQSIQNKLPTKSFRDLEWQQLQEQITRATVTGVGHSLASHLPPLPNEEFARQRMDEIWEVMQLLDTDDEPPIRGWKDIDKALAHVTREGTLIAEDLQAIARNCDVAARCVRYFRSRESQLKHLASVGTRLDACTELREVLHYAVEPGGRLSDQASPDLGRLRRAVQNQHERLQARVESMLKSPQMETVLQDEYFTVREDRYVLPVRIGAKGQLGGIVHGYSSTGQTAYIEPSDLVELNNQLRWAQIELEEEESRILQRLSHLVAEHVLPLTRNGQILAYLDLIVACAKVSRQLKATVPEISADELELIQARHPLLYIKFESVVDGEPVNDTVPNDIRLVENKRVLIISGPNTGGKTVALKTLGLCALMVRFGLPLPVQEGSKIPFFNAIYTDIGDEQSIERDLSTFSAHLVNINSFVERCDRHTLVLLDELFTGTDPMQGAALAVALLERLADAGSLTAVTTHMEGLKTLAYQSELFANASMGFDIESLSPTYHMTMGIPGSSYAIRIAQRLGFPQTLIQRANEVLEGQEHHSIEEVIAALEDQMQEVRKEHRSLQHQRYLAEQTQRKFKEKYNKLLSKERASIHEQTRQLRDQLRQAHKLIRDKLKELQHATTMQGRAPSQQDLQRMQQELKQSEEVIEHATELTRPKVVDPAGLVRVQPNDIEERMQLYARPFKRKVSVVSYQAGDPQALVQVGAMKANVAIDQLYYTTETQRQTHIRGKSNDSKPSAIAGQASEAILLPQTSDNTVDLRGMRVDEAVEKLELFLDAKYLQNIDGVYIIHGHGTGALKRAVRAHLPESPYVLSFRRGEREEGGDGVTIAFLRREGE